MVGASLRGRPSWPPRARPRKRSPWWAPAARGAHIALPRPLPPCPKAPKLARQGCQGPLSEDTEPGRLATVGSGPKGNLTVAASRSVALTPRRYALPTMPGEGDAAPTTAPG